MNLNLSKQAKNDLILLVFFNIVIFIIFAITDALEHLIKFANEHENYELDEIISISFILSISMILFSIRRVKETRLLMEQLAQIASNDVLTRLYNRKFIQKLLETEVYRFNHSGIAFSVILLELDNLKQINEDFGQYSGDQVLVNVAQCLNEAAKTMDSIARWSGSEFLMVCPDTDTQAAIAITSKLLKLIRNLRFQTSHTVTASIGITSCLTGDNVEAIINRASTALEKAKQQGKNRFITNI